jgi:hypothetical protein
MPLMVSEGLGDRLAGKNIYPDTNFLSVLHYDIDALIQFLELAKRGSLIIDPLIRFEFLQSVYLPQQRQILEKFIDNDKVFLPATEHQSIFKLVSENALTLSYLYAHNGCKSASLVDMFLASRVILNGRALIVTADRRDYSPALFSLVGTLSYERNGKNDMGQITCFSVLEFSKSKYEDALVRWNNL